MKFADFDVDVAAGELRRNGVRVKIQDLPFRVLVVLLNHAGEVVTRDQLRAELWGAETFVDAEAGLNTAIAKLREALGDNAESPRFIQTLPKRGYRFAGASIVGQVGTSQVGQAGTSRVGQAGASIVGQAETSLVGQAGASIGGQAGALPVGQAETSRVGQAEASHVGQAGGSRFGWVRRGLSIATVVVLIAVALGAWKVWMAPRPVTIAVVLFHNETGDAAFDQLAQQLTDGTVVALAANPRYAVIGNAAILRTPRIFSDIQKIGAALNADYLVLGQVQRAGSGLIVRAHFIRVNDQKHLWAQGIPGEPAGLDSLVPQTVGDAVDAALGVRPSPRR